DHQPNLTGVQLSDGWKVALIQDADDYQLKRINLLHCQGNRRLAEHYSDQRNKYVHYYRIHPNLSESMGHGSGNVWSSNQHNHNEWYNDYRSCESNDNL